VLIFGRDHWPPHRPWLFFTILATAAASVWYFMTAAASPHWPGGSSFVGFTLGILGGLICLFEFLLWARKKVRVWRIGRAQAWMRAHIWLGLLCVPFLVYHSGFRFGSPLSTVLMVLVLVVVASGVYGLVLQNLLPQKMLDDVPAETIYSQIDRLSAQLADEAEALIRATCGPLPGEEARSTSKPDLPGGAPGATHLIVGAVRSVGRVQGKVLETRAPAVPIPEAEPLRPFYRETVEPYLKGVDGSPLAAPARAAAMFDDVRTKVPREAHGTVNALEGFCDQRRQWARQARLHFWLHNWLWIHFPLSVALIVLMFVHVYVALKYW
jgi:hypothetical protein